MRTNKERVVEISVMGKISHPTVRMPRIDRNGKPYYVPSVGGITYNFTLGDLAFKPYADHVEPDVSTKNTDKAQNEAYMSLSCIGNEAIVVSGEAKGMKGFVIGKHGGIDHVLIHFEDLSKLSIEDKVLVKARGQGLELLDHPDVKVMNIDPNLFDKLPIEEVNGKIYVHVRVIVPGYLMGSGMGASNPHATDYDINTHDEKLIRDLGIDKVRIGDLVAIDNHENFYALGGYKEGAISIGVVVHSNCIIPGHGPGVVVIMTGNKEKIVPVLGEKVNIKDFM